MRSVQRECSKHLGGWLSSKSRRARVRLAASCTAGFLLLAFACDGDRGPAGPPGSAASGPVTSTVLARNEDAPAIIVSIQGLSGASGPNGTFQVGDLIAVHFTLTKDDGTRWEAREMSSGRALVSGPTSSYQRVLPLVDDVHTSSEENGAALHTYTFPTALPATYLPPYNDSPSFDASHGELTGQPLVGGTYTLGLSFAWEYKVESAAFLQVGEASFDFLLGSGGGPLTAREVSSQENCNVCHVTLQGHEGRYRSLTMCLLCHTKGAEDKNDPSLAGGTPGVSIDSAVLFHKLHNGSHLPSVNGIAVDANGLLDYSIPARPYQVVGEGGVVRDYSTVGSPIWPNRTSHMPRDFGYSALGAMAQMQDDVVRTGLVGCIVCHLDPDGNGPVAAPAQGELAYDEPSRAACESCHDDVDWESEYRVNTGLMPPQADDASCHICHTPFFLTTLEVESAHRHPLRDPAFNPGLNLELLGVAEAGNHDADGTLDPGEKVSVTFSMRDNQGNDIPPQLLSSLRALVSGPTENMHLILDEELPLGLLVGPQPFTMNLPARKRMEFVGDSSTGLETFGTRFTPDPCGAAFCGEVIPGWQSERQFARQ